MRSKSLIHIGLAAALFGSSVILSSGYQISAIVAAALLTVSAAVLCLNEVFSNSVWRRIVKICSKIDVGYAAFGLGICGAGINLFQPNTLPFGVLFLLAGACIIGIGIGKNLEEAAVSAALRFSFQRLN